MAQERSALWKSLWRQKNTKKEYGFKIDGVWYGADKEIEHSYENGLYESFGIGNATSAVLNLRLYAEDIPRGAKIERFMRLVNGDEVSEWLPKGVFWINKKPFDEGVYDIEAFDAMRKADYPMIDTEIQGNWPRNVVDVVNEIAERMGVDIDPRTELDTTLSVPYPGTYNMREVLAQIATPHIGNWIISDKGELWLVPLLSLPANTDLLVTENGEAIKFGEVRILV